MRTNLQAAVAAVVAALLAAGCSGGNGAAREANEAEAAAPAEVSGAAGAAGNEATAEAATLQVHGEGLRLAPARGGDSSDVAFGEAQAELLERLAFLGRPTPETNSECGAGPMEIAQFDGRLSLLFQQGRFAGWSIDGRSENRIATAQGIVAGSSSRSELEAAYPGVTVEESTLGHEFNAGGLGGLLDGTGPDARITAMWAGTTCMFR